MAQGQMPASRGIRGGRLGRARRHPAVDRGAVACLIRPGWPADLCRPELVVEIKYLTWTDDNLLRQVVYQGLREDKPAAEVQRPLPARNQWRPVHTTERPVGERDPSRRTAWQFGTRDQESPNNSASSLGCSPG